SSPLVVPAPRDPAAPRRTDPSSPSQPAGGARSFLSRRPLPPRTQPCPGHQRQQVEVARPYRGPPRTSPNAVLLLPWIAPCKSSVQTAVLDTRRIGEIE